MARSCIRILRYAGAIGGALAALCAVEAASSRVLGDAFGLASFAGLASIETHLEYLPIWS